MAERRLYAGAALVFLTASALTAYYVDTMSGGMPMAGGWTMSMMWMRMPDQSALDGAVMFALMWLAMMVAMMLPSALPMMLLFRRAAAFARGPRRGTVDSWMLGAGYFGVWLIFGLIAYGIGVAISEAAMRSARLSLAVPKLAGGAMVAAGLYQLTPWKLACLRHCRDPLHLVAQHLHARFGPLAMGIHHGAFCAACCWALMVVQLMIGVMNVSAMVAIAAIIALEKFMPRGDAIARVAGVAAMTSGVLMVVGVI